MVKVNPEQQKQMADWLARAELDAAATQSNEVENTVRVSNDGSIIEIPFISQKETRLSIEHAGHELDLQSAATQITRALFAPEAKPVDKTSPEYILFNNYLLLQHLLETMYDLNSDYRENALDHCFYSSERTDLFKSMQILVPLKVKGPAQYCIIGMTERYIKLFISREAAKQSRETNLTFAFSRFFNQKHIILKNIIGAQ